jgi:integrase
VYPDVSLDRARRKRDAMRELLADGINPSAHRQQMKAASAELAANTFEAVARAWLAKNAATWMPAHGKRIKRRLEVDVLPWLGPRPIAEITPREVLKVLHRIEGRGAIETAHRAMSEISQVFRFAIACQRAETDPTRDLRGALKTPAEEHHAAITDQKGVGELIRALRGYKGSFVTSCALRLAPLVFVRPGELRHAEWSEIDLDKAEWLIPAEKMKAREKHRVPLSQQAVEILRELQPLTGGGRYVFPSVRSAARPMSDNTVLAALRRLGYTGEQMTGHGFRSLASTLLNEHGWNADAIERQLAHAERDNVRAAYNYAEYLPERRRMMQAWADYLDALAAGEDAAPAPAGGNVVPLKQATA